MIAKEAMNVGVLLSKSVGSPHIQDAKNARSFADEIAEKNKTGLGKSLRLMCKFIEQQSELRQALVR